jgi:hypothetical protein
MRILSALLVAALCALSTQHAQAQAPAAADPKANFREKGRVGIIGALTEDMWKGGLVFEHEYFEVQVLAHAGFEGKTRDVHTLYKLGGRVALGTLNYFAAGFEYGPHPGSKDDGVKIGGSYQMGPYLSLQRYFAATPVMLNLWVNPVQYDHSLFSNGSGGTTTVNAWRVFQTGGFGIAYLFF